MKIQRLLVVDFGVRILATKKKSYHLHGDHNAKDQKKSYHLHGRHNAKDKRKIFVIPRGA